MPATVDALQACAGAARNCELLTLLAELHAERCAEADLQSGEERLSAAAVGLVIEVWRNSPVEDMHASSRGPSDAAMFAESTRLHRHALEALTVANRYFGLVALREHLLDRTRVWPATSGRTLRQVGHGFLGDYDKHVKNKINVLMSLDDHTCVEEPLQIYLITRAVGYGREHKGMPAWNLIVDRIAILLTTPDHPAWWQEGRGAQALADMPASAGSISELTAALRSEPSALPPGVLDWLSRYLLFCAGPSYSISHWPLRADPD